MTHIMNIMNMYKLVCPTYIMNIMNMYKLDAPQNLCRTVPQGIFTGRIVGFGRKKSNALVYLNMISFPSI